MREQCQRVEQENSVEEQRVRERERERERERSRERVSNLREKFVCGYILKLLKMVKGKIGNSKCLISPTITLLYSPLNFSNLGN